MTTEDSPTARLMECLTEALPRAQGPRRKAGMTFVAAILDKQNGTQAELAGASGKGEAAVTCARLSPVAARRQGALGA